jgi:2-polyprenyl-3-methyl-5-hydroxy-6-metoxy-1,4-benzoquinol methylase
MNNLRVPLIRDTLISYRTSSFEIRNSEEKYSNEELLRSPLLGLNILDIGCGGGLLSEVRSMILFIL